VQAERVRAFAPGRVNLIGEHTDYNGGLALPFAIAQGVAVSGVARAAHQGRGSIHAVALDLGEEDEFTVGDDSPVVGWRAFVRGAAAELTDAGYRLPGARIEIAGDVPQGAGLSSSAALEVALCLALGRLAFDGGPEPIEAIDPVALAKLCARIENRWVGARTGLLDQLASLCGAPEHAVLIDFRSLEIERIPVRLDGWRLVVLDSGERHENVSSPYNERRAECARACELLGVSSLREADEASLPALPEPLRRRAKHVIAENGRVRAAAAALRGADLGPLGPLLDASHASLRDCYEVSTPALDAAAERLRAAGATGARMVGGGFGGSVLGLFPPAREPPSEAREVRPSAGARLLEPRASG
jgi:galactokinase